MHETSERFSRRLERRRRLSRLALAFERLWPALWPPLGILGAFIALALFGVIALLPPWPHLAVLVLALLALITAATLSLARFTFPSRAAADRRLEAVNGLAHRPLAVLSDHMASQSGAARALWRAHVERTGARLAHVRVGLPHPGLAAHDRHALRVGVILALVAGAIVAGSDALPRVADAFTPRVPTGPAPPAPELAAWITPPAYTHLPPIFLAPPGGAVSVPLDSELAVSITGGVGTPRLRLAGRAFAFRAIGHHSFRAAARLEESGSLVLDRGGHRLGAWHLAMVPPGAPFVAFMGRPGPAPGSAATRIPWKIADRYGVTDLTAILSLTERPSAKPIRVPIPLANVDPRHASGAALSDLSANPWAGLEVSGVLVARNGAGAMGKSARLAFRLPEISFHNPIARALIAVRKGLAVAPEERGRAVLALGKLSQDPAVRNGDFGGFLNLRAIGALLSEDRSRAAIGEAEHRLWELAWHYEAGPMARTRRALAAAERALDRALAQAGKQSGPKAAQLDQRIARLERAIQNQIAQLAKSLTEKGITAPNLANSEHFDAKTFSRLTEAMRQAVDRGDLPTARREMAELQRLLQQLRNARMPSPSDLSRARQFQKAQQAMSALSDVVGREGRLANHAEARLSQQAQRNSSLPGSKPQARAGTPSASADKATQDALRRALGVLMGDLADATGKVPSALGNADVAMRGASGALGQGANGRAAALERQAIADLQKGGQQAMAALSQQGQEQGSGQGQGFMLGLGPMSGNTSGDGMGEANGMGFDPLGRPLGGQSEGGRATGYVAIPDQNRAAAARTIEEELRRRIANPMLSAPDRAYIDRLLKQF